MIQICLINKHFKFGPQQNKLTRNHHKDGVKSTSQKHHRKVDDEN